VGKPTGFLEYNRELPQKRDVASRKQDYKEIEVDMSPDKVQTQAARCMDCGTPFCHNGCPLGNIIPEFNDAVWESNWEQAFQILSSTNNFPEFTGRICPAPCEASCVLGINKPPVTIEYIEKSIVEQAYKNGWAKPQPPLFRSGKQVAVVGGGPAGLAAADQLNKAGHSVTVFERADKVGGLLRYGIPDFKLDKSVIDRRVSLMEQEGVTIKTNVYVGNDINASSMLDQFDAILLSGGSTVARGITRDFFGKEVIGWDTYLGKGVHFAMEFLSQQNKRVAGVDLVKDHKGETYHNGSLLATDKNIVVIGGGDTGSDCIGTSNRHGAKSIMQVEVMPQPAIDDKKEPYFQKRDTSTPWPMWPLTKRTSTSHEEGCERFWSINIKEFIGDGEKLTHIRLSDIAFEVIEGKVQKVEKNERVVPADMALIAAGFLHPQHEGLLDQFQDILLEVKLDEQVMVEMTGYEAEKPKKSMFDERGNVKARNYATDLGKVFAAGDMRRGQSLVVWAIHEGREAARAIDVALMGASHLEAKAVSMFSTV
jgi:glutamate synthase (NADPH) small chain